MSKVFMTTEITSESLVKIYRALGIELSGRVAVKISSGEPGGHNFLRPELIADLVKQLSGTIVECNTAYPGKRDTTKAHLQTMKDHGFMNIAPCDIMDGEADMAIPVNGGVHLKENYVGANLKNYDSMVMLSHFKGHMMGGFGGALKNMSIGIASSRGKLWIHSAATTSEDANKAFATEQNAFLESMADADKSVMDYMGKENIVYINVANKLSIDCDCDANPKDPEMADLGIYASLDPVAVDQACVDAVYNSTDMGKTSLIERMEDKNGIHTIEAAHKLGLGSRQYEIVCID